MHHYFVVICVTTSRYINVDASNIQNIHTQVSAVHSVSDAVSVVFVSEGFTNTNVIVLSHGYVGTFSSLYGTVQVWDVLTFEMGYTTY